jgi:hypothetical protein
MPNRPSPSTPTGVADEKENARLKHSQGGTTTRDDATDVGVPMLPGDPSEPVGPEDALGLGPKRGDYSDRIGPAGYNPTETRRVQGADDGEATARVEAQRPRAEDIGDERGVKGGTRDATA